MAASTGSRSQTNGVLPITASQTSGNTQKQISGKPPLPRLKVIVRRLPPGLTANEFTSVLGDEWKLGQGKVDWLLYKPGKDSKDPSKPSRPSRAYLHLTNELHLISLSDLVRQTTFEDAQNTYSSPCLVGPPAVEFAPYGRIPSTRQKVDARAGTIDQDSEFMAFLEGLANPASSKDGTETSAANEAGKAEKITTTPLVQYLKDKKANKTKEAAAKAAKKQEAQLAKVKAAKESTKISDDAKKKGKDVKVEKTVEKAAKEAVKILNREAATKTSTPVGPSGGSRSDAPSSTPKLDTTKVPGRQRGALVAAHIRMLQRDLGLSPAQAHRQVRRNAEEAKQVEKAASAEKPAAESKDAGPSATPVLSAPTAPKGISSSRRGRDKSSGKAENSKVTTVGTTPQSTTSSQSSIVLLKKNETSQSPAAGSTAATAKPTSTSTPSATKTAQSAVARKSQSAAGPSEGATQAFVKHANPSQGVTEALLKAAMETFGLVSHVEIDRRKGFAYVDFVDSDGLKKAMAANPISVAQGTVHVLQRKGANTTAETKTQPPQQAPSAPRAGSRGGRGGSVGRRGNRGGGGGGRGGGAASQAQATTVEQLKTSASIITPTGPAPK